MKSGQEASSSTCRYTYHVFLSFRGKDTRKAFTDHLYTALVRAGFLTFRDDDGLEIGEDIKSDLEKAIRESRMSIIVFSKSYASSTWCLDELVMILKRRFYGHVVLPVFYDVNPSEVRKQSGSFEEAFAKHEKKLKSEKGKQKEELKKKVGAWRAALKDVGNLAGMNLRNQADGHEARFIEKIIKVVGDKVSRTTLYVAPTCLEYIHKSKTSMHLSQLATPTYQSTVETCSVFHGGYIDAAFRSSYENEAYLFMKNEYVLVDYAPGTSYDMLLNGPLHICEGFPSLRNTAFAEYGIDSAFGCHYGNQAFIFSGNLCVLIDYEPHTPGDKIIKGPMTITEMFPFFEGTVFESGIDAAFESSISNEAYLFKGNQYARINYDNPGLLFRQTIVQGFGSTFKGTIFESGIEAAFASHRPNEAYLFKGDSYARIYFMASKLEHYIIGGVRKIHSSWPSLNNILPRKNINVAFAVSHTDKPTDGGNLSFLSIGGYIDAAFRSSYQNEAYLFMKNEYVLVDYAPGTSNDKVLNEPLCIQEGFPSLRNTAFAEYGIDSAFGCHYGNQAFIFSGNLCALIDYAPHTRDDKIIKGPMTITEMFPFFKGTAFESGLDTAFESSISNEAYLFKGNQYACINYNNPGILFRQTIVQGFGATFKGTIFESGIEAAFASHRPNEVYLFKGDSYARIHFMPSKLEHYIIGGVRKMHSSWPSLNNILPRINRGLEGNFHTVPNPDPVHDEL